MRIHHGSSSPYEKRYGFSRAVRSGSDIHVAGTAPIAADGSTFAGDAYEQARRCFEIAIEAVEALGGVVADVVRTRIYLCDPADADAVGRAHAEAFADARPAATMVVVASLLDPAWRVEVELVARLRPR
ncbi:MAG: RidA family protein [Planctomycetota bacterium]|jgi:enamine deaminase RidA (YjgF/YER057c/UK114 family)